MICQQALFICLLSVPSIRSTLGWLQKTPGDHWPELPVWWGVICRGSGMSSLEVPWSTQRDPCGNTFQGKGPDHSEVIKTYLFCQQGHGDEVKQACESRAYSTYHTAGYELPWSEEVSRLCTGDWTLITAGLGLKLKCVTCIHWSGVQVDRGCALMIWRLL